MWARGGQGKSKGRGGMMAMMGRGGVRLGKDIGKISVGMGNDMRWRRSGISSASARGGQVVSSS
jgi:hypothetical protein